jgi:dipeptidyl aminopeptidase/acylaminoacyl peptidase
VCVDKRKAIPIFIVVFLSFHGSVSTAEQPKKLFTITDDIGLKLFGNRWSGQAVRFSPDGNYLAVDTERGRLGPNSVEGSLRFYRSPDLDNFLRHSHESQPPLPVWVVNRSHKEGPAINDWRWLADSSGVAFLEPTAGGNQQLVLADVDRRMFARLTPATETVRRFDILDRQHYVYTVEDEAEGEKERAERQAPSIVGTGRLLFQLLFPDDGRFSSRRSSLRAFIGGKRFQVQHDGARLFPEGDLVLSPDGVSLVTTLSVPEVPSSWETVYPPPYLSDHFRIHAGHDSARQYVRINLRTGSIQTLTDAPTSDSAGWWAYGSPSWSSDGSEILLPGTFLRSRDRVPSRPCVAVVDLVGNMCTCVEMLKGVTETGFEDGFHAVAGARFAEDDNRQVIVTFHNHEDPLLLESTNYHRAEDGSWQVVGQTKGDPLAIHNGLEITVTQGLNEPPRLIARNKETSRVVWDPNPQLKNIDLGRAKVYTWKDNEGRNWRGGLFEPSNYKGRRRYPLVIQTHGFSESEFVPSGGMFPTRSLTAAGIVVLQVDEPCPTGTPSEGPCAVSGYESAANQLVSEGLVDPVKIGIIGFSRTCFYVMEALTSGSFHLKAATTTDGVMLDYFQYMLQPERLSTESNSMIGAQPFGQGLQQWLRRSPGFNLDSVTAPLLVVAEGTSSLLFNWGPYAGLRYLHKPVDLMLLNTDEHVLTNPAVRMASQEVAVDWFRFWLQDYEDSDPAKAGQYIRWHELRKLQLAGESRLVTPKNGSN